MKNSKINQKIIDLWAKYFKPTSDVKVPMFYGTPKKGGILFIGTNPSYSEKAFEKLTKGSSIITMKVIHEVYDYSSFVKVKDKPDRVKFIIDREEIWSDMFPKHFKPMIKIAEINKTFPQYINLFLYRETKNGTFLRSVIEKKDKDNINFNDFGKDQLKIFKEVLKQYFPKVIILIDSKSSQIFKQEFSDSLEWNEKKGYHLYKNNTPIFFDQGDLSISDYSKISKLFK